MNPYRITDENSLIKYTLNQRRTNIDYNKKLIMSKSKIELDKSRLNQEKNSYRKIKYQISDINNINNINNFSNKIRHNIKEFNKSYITPEELEKIKNINYNYNYNYDYNEHQKLFNQKNKSFISSNNYRVMNMTSQKNLKAIKQDLLEKINKNKIQTNRIYKTNHSINNLNDILIGNNNSNQRIISNPKKSNNNIKNSNNKRIRYIPLEKNNILTCGNSTTTTNNTYNNNIYYINPIDYINNKIKKKINTNLIYKNVKSVDAILNKKKLIKKHKKEMYIKSVILIQSIFRAYLVKIKLYNNLKLYLSYKRSIEILQKIFLQRKKNFFLKKLKNIFSYKILNKIISNTSLFYQKRNSYINLYHKELGDSFNIRGEKSTEKKLEIKLNELMKENKELKHHLCYNKNIKEKIEVLSQENKKIKSINNIILKDNKQLAKKLKDLKEYKKSKLVIQKDIEKMQIHENNENDEELYNKNKLRKILLNKIIEKKIKEKKIILKLKWEKYKYIINNIKNKEGFNNKLKKIYLINAINIIDKYIKTSKRKIFLVLYNNSIIKQANNIIIKEKLKNVILSQEKNRMNILYHSLFNIVKYNNKKNDNKLKGKILGKIMNKYLLEVKAIYKIYLEKWNLKSKLIGIKTAARDKKRKRKQKQKINKLLYNKHYLVVDDFKHRDNSSNNFPRLSKSIQGFNYIVPDNNIINKPNMEEGELIIGNLSTNNIKYIYKKTKSVNKARTLSENMAVKKIEKENVNININKENNYNDNNNNEEINSDDEDSGESFGLGGDNSYNN